MIEFYLKKYPKDIVEYAFDLYPVEEQDIPDIDEGCPSCYTEDTNAEARHHFILGALWERTTNDIDKHGKQDTRTD
ncbi:MAG: hypothetical protein ACI3ZC_01265 [Candidatus Cryptobacteroides sp.]